MPEWEVKNWGRVWHQFYNDRIGYSELEVISGQRTSLHYHLHRWNSFICIDATIVVEGYGGIYDDEDAAAPAAEMTESWTLYPGDSAILAPNFWHLFKVIKPGRVVEVYYTTDGTPVDPDDIVRFDEGCAI